MIEQREAFPPVHTPTAFRSRAELISDAAAQGESGDLSLLAHERSVERRPRPPVALLILAFLAAAGIGLGVTVLIAKLV